MIKISDPTNQYGMTQSQWNQYQSNPYNQQHDIGPAQYTWQNDPNAGGTPPADHYQGGAFVAANQPVTQSQAQLNAVNAREAQQTDRTDAEYKQRQVDMAKQRDAVAKQEAEVDKSPGTTHGRSGATSQNQKSGVSPSQLEANRHEQQTQHATITPQNKVARMDTSNRGKTNSQIIAENSKYNQKIVSPGSTVTKSQGIAATKEEYQNRLKQGNPTGNKSANVSNDEKLHYGVMDLTTQINKISGDTNKTLDVMNKASETPASPNPIYDLSARYLPKSAADKVWTETANTYDELDKAVGAGLIAVGNAIKSVSKPGTQGETTGQQLIDRGTGDAFKNLGKDADSVAKAYGDMRTGLKTAEEEGFRINGRNYGTGSIPSADDLNLSRNIQNVLNAVPGAAIGGAIKGINTIGLNKDPNVKKIVDDLNAVNTIGQGMSKFVGEGTAAAYNAVTRDPLGSALDVALLKGGGEQAGAIFEGSTGLAKIGADTIAAKKIIGISKAAEIAAPLIKPTASAIVAGQMGIDAVKTIQEGDIGKDIEFTKNFIIGGAGFEKGAESQRELNSKIAEKLNLVERNDNTLTSSLKNIKNDVSDTLKTISKTKSTDVPTKTIGDTSVTAYDHRTEESKKTAAKNSNSNYVANSRGNSRQPTLDTHGYSANDISTVDDYMNGLLTQNEAKNILLQNGHTEYETNQLLKGKFPEATQVYTNIEKDIKAIHEVEGKPIANGAATAYDNRTEIQKNNPVQKTENKPIELTKNEQYIKNRVSGRKLNVETAKQILIDSGVSPSRANAVLEIKSGKHSSTIEHNGWRSTDNRTARSKEIAEKNISGELKKTAEKPVGNGIAVARDNRTEQSKRLAGGENPNYVAKNREITRKPIINTNGYTSKDISIVAEYHNGQMSYKDALAILTEDGRNSVYDAKQLMKGNTGQSDTSFKIENDIKSINKTIKTIEGKPIANGNAMAYDNRSEKSKTVADKNTKNSNYLAKNRNNIKQLILDTYGYSSSDISIVDDYLNGMMSQKEAIASLKANGHSAYEVDQLLKGKFSNASQSYKLIKGDIKTIREVEGKPGPNGVGTVYDYRTEKTKSSTQRQPKPNNKSPVEKITNNQNYSIHDLSVIDDYNKRMLSKEDAIKALKSSGFGDYDINQALKRTLTSKWDEFEKNNNVSDIKTDISSILKVIEKNEPPKTNEPVTKLKNDKIKIWKPEPTEEPNGKAIDAGNGQKLLLKQDVIEIAKDIEAVKATDAEVKKETPVEKEISDLEKNKRKVRTYPESVQRISSPVYDNRYHANAEEEYYRTPYVNTPSKINPIANDTKKISDVINQFMPYVSGVPGNPVGHSPSSNNQLPNKPANVVTKQISKPSTNPPMNKQIPRIIQDIHNTVDVKNATSQSTVQSVAPTTATKTNTSTATKPAQLTQLSYTQAPVPIQDIATLQTIYHDVKTIHDLTTEFDKFIPPKKPTSKLDTDIKKVADSHINMSRLIKNSLLSAETFF